jgi:hypothetical protein
MNQAAIALDAPWPVHYGQIYVLSPECEPVMPADAFEGQRNGLCGAGVEGGLFLATGLHTGYVHMRIEVHTNEPPIDDEWEEIVEVSCFFPQTPVVLEDWSGNSKCELPIAEGMYRVRYSAKRFGQAQEGNGVDGEALVERYSVLFWPSPRRADQVIKETSERAAYWNDGAWTKKN